MGLIQRNFAKKLYRTAEDFRFLKSSWNRVLKIAIFAACALAFYAFSSDSFTRLVSRWENRNPEVSIDKDLSGNESWQVRFGENGSYIPRNSAEHIRLKRADLDSDIYFKNIVPIDQLKKASENQAFNLVLGWFRGSSEVFVNGKLYFKMDRINAEAIAIVLSHERLMKDKEIEILVKVKNFQHRPDIDRFNLSLPTGFYSQERLESLRSYHRYSEQTRPLMNVSLNLMIAFLFFVVWCFLPLKTEHFYLGMFAFFNAAYQFRIVEFVYLYLLPSDLLLYSIVIKSFVGATGMLLGFAIARMRTKFMAIGGILALALPMGSYLVLGSFEQRQAFDVLMNKFWFPFAFLIGAAACGIQAAYFLSRAKKTGKVTIRGRIVIYSMLGLISMAYVYWNKTPLPGVNYATSVFFSHHMTHIMLVLYLAIVLLSEVRHQEELVATTPVSAYHKMSTLPEKVHGAILTIDVKNSESFFKIDSSEGSHINWIGLWRAQSYLVISKLGGVVLQKKGDEIQVFFDSDRMDRPELMALRAFDEICTASKNLGLAMEHNEVMKGLEINFCIRASLVMGEIKPIWEQMGEKKREPYWEQAAGSNAFVEAARLLDAEKEIVTEKSVSAVVFSAVLAERLDLSKQGGKTLLETKTVVLKHDEEYDVAGYSIKKAS